MFGSFPSAAVYLKVSPEGEGFTPSHRETVKKYVMLRANGANTSAIMIGHSAGGAADGFILSAGQQSPALYVDQLNKLYLVGGAADQGYSWIAC